MKNLRIPRFSRNLLAGALSLTPLALAGPIPTTVIPLRPSEIAKAAEQVVVGTVTGKTCRLAADGFGIQTLVTLENLLVHKGSVLAPSLTLEFAGGQLGERRQVVPDMPELQVGKRYLLYVEGNGKFVSPIVGFWQGAFEIRNEAGREVLVNLKGEQLVAIVNDAYVFLRNGEQPGSLAPEAVATARRAPAAKDNHTLEALLKQQRAVEVRHTEPVPELPARTTTTPTTTPVPVDVPIPAAPKTLPMGEKKHEEYRPIYLSSKEDRGERAALITVLQATR